MYATKSYCSPNLLLLNKFVEGDKYATETMESVARPHTKNNSRQKLLFSFSPLFSSLPLEMIAPIVGKFRKQFIKDLIIAGSLASTGGYVWWHHYHIPSVQRRDAFYAKLEASKDQ
ncbi:hypothetical protein VTP01DRAFT_6045 [Rhizomucor pusillus]|uniref:uncharacterized protein n=1 Tax=Rhizomucor pusillus TaxID=4840 RepID=UPI003743AADD